MLDKIITAKAESMSVAWDLSLSAAHSSDGSYIL